MVDLLANADVADHWIDESPCPAVLPAQFYSERNGPAFDDPLHRLMRAILADAIRCFQMGLDARHPQKRRLYADTRSWFFADDCDGVFSFRAVCDVLGTDPRTIRKGLVNVVRGASCRKQLWNGPPDGAHSSSNSCDTQKNSTTAVTIHMIGRVFSLSEMV